MYNPKDYKKKEWLIFRRKIWLDDGCRCVRCGKHIDNPSKAQIHHRIYLPDRLPWQYDETDCECLCAGCHLEEHGRKMPSFNWRYIGCTTYDHYGDTYCDLCGSELKYEHEIWHPDWGTLNVGIGCCDNLTSTLERQEMRRQQNYRKRLNNMERWKAVPGADTWSRKFDGYNLMIRFEQGKYRIYIENRRGQSEHPAFKAALEHLADILYSGEIDSVFAANNIPLPEARRKKLDAYARRQSRLPHKKSPPEPS